MPFIYHKPTVGFVYLIDAYCHNESVLPTPTNICPFISVTPLFPLSVFFFLRVVRIRMKFKGRGGGGNVVRKAAATRPTSFLYVSWRIHTFATSYKEKRYWIHHKPVLGYPTQQPSLQLLLSLQYTEPTNHPPQRYMCVSTQARQ